MKQHEPHQGVGQVRHLGTKVGRRCCGHGQKVKPAHGQGCSAGNFSAPCGARGSLCWLCRDTPGSRVTFGMGLRKPGMRGSCRGKAPSVPLDGGETGSPAQTKGMTQEVIPQLPSLWNTKELGMMKHSDKSYKNLHLAEAQHPPAAQRGAGACAEVSNR